MNNLQIDAEKITNIESNGLYSVSVLLSGVSLSDIVGQFSAEELLQEMEFSDIEQYVTDYVTDRLAEDDK